MSEANSKVLRSFDASERWSVSSQDYQLLERMNLASAEKYRDLADHAGTAALGWF